MLHVRSVIRKGSLGLSALIVLVSLPLGTLSADPSTCTPQSINQPGNHSPTGSDAGTYSYVCDPASPYYGKYINAYYVYNPISDNTSPLYAPDYAYNCTTGLWYKTVMEYDAPSGNYYKAREVSGAPAGIPTNCPVAAAAANTGSPSANSDPNSVSGGSGISGTGPSSNNSTNLTGNNNFTLNNTNNLGVTNNLTGLALSGNAVVSGNTSAGNAATGNTQDIQNIVNMLQSSTNALGAGSNVITFTDNIDGDVNGDLMLNPAALASSIQNTGPNSTNAGDTNLNNNLTINNTTNASIDNNINLNAASGDASVTENTSGGNATSGAAQNIANVVNMIDSALQAGQSFIGTININGNLNGDILLPPNFVDQLLAANVPTVTLTGPDSSNTSNTSVNNTTKVTNTNNQGITNNVNANASTGSAAVSDNTSAGNATSGAANNSIVAFNLTGSKVIGANDLLVFVNVVGGSWVGLIVNAPPGANAAELGGGISVTGPNSTNSTDTTVNNDAKINNKTNQQINNNITTTAKSGNASVTDNTKGGNATSGDADNAINLLNVEHSTLSLSNWFGILFINVFGSWNGSFGVNTAAGDPLSNATNFASTAGGGSSTSPSLRVFRFVPTGSGGSGGSSGAGGFSSYLSDGYGGGSQSSHFAANVAARTGSNNSGGPASTQGQSAGANLAVPVASLGLFSLYIVGDFFYTRAHRRAGRPTQPITSYLSILHRH
ncbi:MAG TPA: hypothetical protein VLF79_00105 [Candidatus Saccharimonadales bacterium]|nr:hypothetical protein [Candidatus Saccharimonadales bacterium]